MHELGNALHFINLRKLAKLAALCISTLLIFTMISAFLSNPVEAASATPLHVSGNQILTADGTPLTLKGLDYTYFIDSEGGSWMLPDGFVEWNTSPMDPHAALDLLNFMQASNCTVVRLHLTVQYWLANSNSYQSNLEWFITQAANRGIYTDFEFYADNSSMLPPNGFPWEDNNGVLHSQADFVNLWGNVSTSLKDYPSVIFELWNEPASNEAGWMAVTQLCVDRIRSTGATQPINVMWNMAIYYDFGGGYNGVAGAGANMNWVTDYPISDPCGNLIYSTHIYRNAFFNSSHGYQQVYSYYDMNYALQYCGVYSVAQSHPVVIFEIGASNWAPDQTNEINWLNNTLTCLDQNGIGYAYFAAPPWRNGATQWSLVTTAANYTLDAAGVAFLAHTGGMNYTDWFTENAPTVTVSPTSQTMDVGQFQTFYAIALGGSGTYTSYQWYVNGVPQSDATASTFSYFPASAGTYSITATVTDSLGVTSVQSSAATVMVNPTVSISPTSQTMDVGQFQTFYAIALGGSGTYTSYQWYVNGVPQSDATASTFSYFPASAGTYSITATVTDSLGVTSVQSSAATVMVNPTVSISPTSQTMDVGQFQTFYAIALGGSGTYTSYQWYVNGVPQSDATASTFSYFPASAGTYSITATVTDSLGVTSVQSSAATVMVSASPTVSIARVGPLTLDVGQVQVFTATVSGGSSSLFYQWYLDGVLVGGNSSSYSYVAVVGSHQVYANVTDGASVPFTAKSNVVSVLVNSALSIAVLPSSASLYVGQVQVFNGTVSGGSGAISYQWYLDSSAVGTNSATFFYTASGTFHLVTCKVTDSASVPVTSPVSNAVSVAVNQLAIKITQSANGYISPAKSTPNYGDTPTFTIAPNAGYHIASITVNNESETVTTPAGQSYEFSPVSTDGSITATFAINGAIASQSPTQTPTLKPTSTYDDATKSISTDTAIMIAFAVVVIVMISLGVFERTKRNNNKPFSFAPLVQLQVY